MIKTSYKVCSKCKYSCVYNGLYFHCDYFISTGKRRGCKVNECDKFEPKKKKMNKQLAPMKVKRR